MWKILEKRPFFRADMAGLGKYSMGGYGRIWVFLSSNVISNKHYELIYCAFCEILKTYPPLLKARQPVSDKELYV